MRGDYGNQKLGLYYHTIVHESAAHVAVERLSAVCLAR